MMARIFEDYDVYGRYGIFLMDFVERKKKMGTTKKRIQLLQESGITFAPDFVQKLAKAGFVPVMSCCNEEQAVLACWHCELPAVNMQESDEPYVIHKRIDDNCGWIKHRKRYQNLFSLIGALAAYHK